MSLESTDLEKKGEEGKAKGSITTADNMIQEQQKKSEKFAGEDKNDVLATSEDSPQDSPLLLSKARCIALVLTTSCAGFFNTLGVAACTIILPTISKDLNIPDSRQQWIVSSYNITFGCFLLLWGRLGDVYGKRLVFLWGAVWSTIASIIVPFMPNEVSFDIFRGLQGVGAAAMVPTAIGILGVTFPPGKAKNYAFSCYGAGAPLGAVFGNIFGGILTEYLTWQWVFWIFAILSAMITVAGYLIIPLPTYQLEPISMSNNSVDWIGGTLITVGILVLLFALTQGNVVGWSVPWIPVLIVVGFLITAAFVVWQYYLEKKGGLNPPLMRVSVFKNTRFAAAMVIMPLFYAGFNNLLITTTYWFQEYKGLSIIQTTVRFVPMGVTGVLTALVCSQLISRINGSVILVFSTLGLGISNVLIAVPLPESTSYWAYNFPSLVLSTAASDTLFPVLTLFTAKSLPPGDQALGGALINAMGQIGRAIGLAIMTALQTAVVAKQKGVSGEDEVELLPGDNALKVGLRCANWFNSALAFTALVVVLAFFRGVGKVGGKH